MTKDELYKQCDFWVSLIQNELYRQVEGFIINNHITDVEMAERLGCSLGCLKEILNGEFNGSVRDIVKILLTVDKAPVLKPIPLSDVNVLWYKDIMSDSEYLDYIHLKYPNINDVDDETYSKWGEEWEESHKSNN